MMPLGIRCSAVFTPLITRVWPALWPPWKRTTPWAISVSQSTTLPLPSSPHWVPTTTTLRPPGFICCMSFWIGCKSADGCGASARADGPLAGELDQFAVALEFLAFVLMAGQDADHRFTAVAQAA